MKNQLTLSAKIFKAVFFREPSTILFLYHTIAYTPNDNSNIQEILTKKLDKI